MKFTFDSSDIGSGPFETRVFCELDQGELRMRLDDGTPVEFKSLSTRDLAQLQDWIRHFQWESHKTLAREFHEWCKQVGG